MAKWNDKQLQELIKLRHEGKTWDELSKKFIGYTANALRKTFYRYEGLESSVDPVVESIKKENSAKKTKSLVLKQNQHIVSYLEKRQDLLSEIKDLIDNVKFTKPKVVKPSIDKKKRKMTIEVMLTDLHYGKKTKTFNAVVARKRMKKYGEVVLSDYKRYSAHYNPEHFILYMGGDMIENASFHGSESLRASEFGNSEQVVLAIRSLYEDMIVPVAATGRRITVVAVRGNHDRYSEHQTYQDPGKEDLTWIIYKTLEQLCELANLKNVTFKIPEGVYHVEDIYGCPVLYEHGDHVKGGLARKTFESHMSKRSKQVGKLIKFGRFGHFHEKTMFGRGKIIVNASLAGQDGYSEINGYDSEASQTINYYIETENRPDPFYHSFPVCLE